MMASLPVFSADHSLNTHVLKLASPVFQSSPVQRLYTHAKRGGGREGVSERGKGKEEEKKDRGEREGEKTEERGRGRRQRREGGGEDRGEREGEKTVMSVSQ